MVRACCTILILGLYAPYAAAQTCFARVSLDRRSVYVQQPFKVTITVLTATWYTAPLDFEGIQIPSAFVLPFDQTRPGMYTVNGKQYAGLQFYYIVFPYKAGSFSIPAISITAQTPPEGSSESRKITLETKPESFTVKPVPENVQSGNWFVAKNVNIEQRWSKSLRDVKVGDIIERTITIDAGGTLPQFIPAIRKDSLAFANTYLQDAELRDERTDYDANGRLTQSVIYLFEKEGEFEIPPVTVSWWNPLSSREYRRSAPGEKIRVNPNPNLGMVASIRDSLQAATAHPAATIPVRKKFTVFGLPWYEALAYLVAAVLLLYVLLRLTRILIRNYKRRRIAWLQSEGHSFKELIHAQHTVSAMIPRLYAWWDRLPLASSHPAITMPPGGPVAKRAEDSLAQYFHEAYREGNGQAAVEESFKSSLHFLRKSRLNEKETRDEANISSFQTLYPAEQNKLSNQL